MSWAWARRHEPTLPSSSGVQATVRIDLSCANPQLSRLQRGAKSSAIEPYTLSCGAVALSNSQHRARRRQSRNLASDGDEVRANLPRERHFLLVATMNAAAEQAVPEAKALMINAIKTMSVEDAKKILSGGDDSVTRFFEAKTAGPLAEKLRPIVKKATDRVGLAQKFNQFAAEGAKVGLVNVDATNVERYVTEKARNGLYLMIGEEEHAVRQNPAAAGSATVSRVFRALR